MTDIEKMLEHLPLLAELAERGMGKWGPSADQFRAEIETLIRRARADGFDQAEDARLKLEGYALILDDKVKDMKALRDNWRRDAGLPEKSDHD